MTTTHPIELCGQDTCLPPAEFVRLRYFFGQRLGVVDFADEQAFHAGKHRFGNLFLHGSGVLCGLTAERYVVPQGAAASQPTTLLRVRRGAALDACGRDIVVGFDQCIDVAAWLSQHPKALPVVAPGALSPQPLTLWVALCYSECPSDPAPAPRDPCGCDAGGCEFARIREGYILKLLTDAEARLIAPPPAGGSAAGATAGGPADPAALLRTSACPSPPADPCLLLARIEAALKTTSTATVTATTVSDITVVDNTIPERQSLLPTATLQRALIQLLASAGDSGLLGPGPTLGAIAFEGIGADGGTLSLEILTDGTPLSRNPLDSPERLTLEILRFDTNDWVPVNPPAATYSEGPPAQIALSWTAGTISPGQYRLVIENDIAQPAVDQKLRPLTPTVWAHQFRLELDADGKLSLADVFIT